LRFQWPALRIVAQAQRDLKDYVGARKTWERIRDRNPHELSANVALANLYRRPRDRTCRAHPRSAADELPGGRALPHRRAGPDAVRPMSRGALPH
jgi:hypothetical protein